MSAVVTGEHRVVVEAWAPEYGTPFAPEAFEVSEVPVDVNAEIAAADWAPITPARATPTPGTIYFVDGVRRIDARVWITCPDGITQMGICASYAAGIVRCDEKAQVTAAEVRRKLLSVAGAPAIETKCGTYAPVAAPETDIDTLHSALQERMRELEIEVTRSCASEIESRRGMGLLVVDGPLRGRQDLPNAVGYIKTHRVAYLPPILQDVVAELSDGQRTPLFVTQSQWTRYSWYLRLPNAEGHPWAGVVRLETSGDLPVEEAVQMADQTAVAIPRFASEPHKDPRAPQNLYPIAGLERELRRRLGDQAYVYRALRLAVV